MNFPLLLLCAAAVMPAADQLRPTARVNACYAMRGDKSAATVEAMVKALDDSKVRACAVENLRVAGATEALAAALDNPAVEVRALAANKLAGFDKPELVAPLAKAARSTELVVASNAVESLATYKDPAAREALVVLSKSEGVVALMALDRLTRLHDPAAVTVARLKIESKDLGQKMGGITVLADVGTKDDIPALREIAKKDTQPVATGGRGFGMMPTISIAKAATTAITRIESRTARQSR